MATSRHQQQSGPILNVKISSYGNKAIVDCVRAWIRANKKTYICVAAVHLIMECQKNNSLLRGVNKSGLTVADGMPLVWLLRKRYGLPAERAYGPSIFFDLCALAQSRGHSIYVLGGAPGQAHDVVTRLRLRLPRLRIVGSRDTPVRPMPKQRNKDAIKHINFCKPNIVFVGMGCPYQEAWMIENRRILDANILIGVGAAFDIVTHRIAKAPAWIQRIGLEWLFRFFQDPTRLWYRYTIMNLQFLLRATGEIFFAPRVAPLRGKDK